MCNKELAANVGKTRSGGPGQWIPAHGLMQPALEPRAKERTGKETKQGILALFIQKSKLRHQDDRGWRERFHFGVFCHPKQQLTPVPNSTRERNHRTTEWFGLEQTLEVT